MEASLTTLVYCVDCQHELARLDADFVIMRVGVTGGEIELSGEQQQEISKHLNHNLRIRIQVRNVHHE